MNIFYEVEPAWKRKWLNNFRNLPIFSSICCSYFSSAFSAKYSALPVLREELVFLTARRGQLGQGVAVPPEVGGGGHHVQALHDPSHQHLQVLRVAEVAGVDDWRAPGIGVAQADLVPRILRVQRI